MIFSPLEKLDTATLSRRPLTIMSVVMLAVLGVALARLFELTIIHGRQNRGRADQNRILVRPIPAPRGVILDRNGISLTRNVPSVREIDFPGDDLGPIPIEAAARSYPFGPALAHAVGYVGEVSQEELENCLSPSNPSAPSNPSCPLESGDITGKSGLEKQYDSLLRGTDGAQLLEVDANGKTLRTISAVDPISGKNLTVNLDANLAVAAYTYLSGKKAAAVALDPADGSVLALVSSPSFDPNIFQKSQLLSAKIGSNQIMDKSEKSDLSDLSAIRSSADLSRDSDFSIVKDLISDTVNMPLFNRAASGEYPPGSIFKLVTASAGLSENKISQVTLIEDTGEIRVGEFRYGNWYFDQYGRTEGAINITRALARSNDIFFYRVGEWLGPQPLADWARRLGLGQKTGVDLPSEADGLVPDPVWKERQIGEKWYLGNTYHMAIGQGDVRVTPLQVAEMAATVITGKKCRPRIASTPVILSDPDVTSGESKDPIGSTCENIDLSPENRNLILSGMVGACSPGGTAFPFFEWNQNRLPPSAPDGASGGALPAVGCKTGTAQHGGKQAKPHAWVAVAAPIVSAPRHPEAERSEAEGSQGNPRLDLDSPKRIVIVVLVEESGEGSYVAAPLAKQILTDWFK